MAWRRMRCWTGLALLTVICLIFIIARNNSPLLFSKPNSSVGGRSEPTTSAQLAWKSPREPLVVPSLAARLNKPHVFKPLPTDVVESVQRFVFFIGYARSSHSIIGSILDAHPNVVIAHEYALFTRWKQQPLLHQNKTWLYNSLYNNSCYNVYKGLRRQRATKKGYTLYIKDSWQGQYDGKILVIGDKSGGMTAKAFRMNRKTFIAQYTSLQATVKVPIHAIHVVRNPYDNIATMLLYNNHIPKTDVDVEHPYINLEMLQSQIIAYFSQVKSVVEMINLLGLNLVEIHSDDLVHTPTKVIHKLCTTLHLTCTQEYINLCTSKVFKTESKSRFLIKWTPFLISMVGQEMKKYSFFDRYSFYH